MKPVTQTKFGCPGGNCYQAVLASILELPLDSVPDFMNMGDGMSEALYSWCGKRGLVPVQFSGKDREILKLVSDLSYVEAVVRSPRNPKGYHSIVWHKGRAVHDPHPSRDSMMCRVEDIDRWTCFIAVNPEAIVSKNQQ